MVRPVRRLEPVRRMVRRRHRTWMLSMTFASLGWGAWWIFLFLTRVAPEHAPTSGVIQWIGVAFALPGFAIAVWTIRAKLAWIVVTLVPLCANGSLLAMPLVMKTIRVIRAERAQNIPPREDAETGVREELGEVRAPARS